MPTYLIYVYFFFILNKGRIRFFFSWAGSGTARGKIRILPPEFLQIFIFRDIKENQVFIQLNKDSLSVELLDAHPEGKFPNICWGYLSWGGGGGIFYAKLKLYNLLREKRKS